MREKFISKSQSDKFLGMPVIRGFVSLIEMLQMGVKTLSFSAKRYEMDFEQEQREKGKEVKKKTKGREKTEEIFGYIFAFGLAFVFFAFLPYKIADMLNFKENFYFNLFAGSMRIVFFVLYVYLISFMKDVKRVFEYHGAEHKSVNAFEKKSRLTPEEVDKFTTIHPRCGTSFIFFVLLVSILIFSIVDTFVAMYLGKNPSLFFRLGYHILLLPVISGVSYEILKLSGKNIEHPLVKILTLPGMALQRITTQPPDLEQLEVAIISMKYALDMDISEYKNVKILEEDK